MLSNVLKTIWWMNIILEMLVQCDTNIDLNLCIYVSDLYFMIKWFCLISWTNTIIGIVVPCDVKIYLIKCMWASDQHFMVQWFCLAAWRLFDGLMLCWRYWFNVTQTLNCRSVTYISWSGDFALYFEDYLMDKCHNWNIGSVWCKD